MLELLLLLFVTVVPICGVVFLILGFWKHGQNARLTDDTPKKSFAMIRWGFALVALTFIGWVFLYFASGIAAQVEQSDGAVEMGIFFLYMAAILLIFLIPLIVLIGLFFLIRGFWLQITNRKKPKDESVQFIRHYLWGIGLVIGACLLIPVIYMGLEPLGALYI